MKKVLVCSIGHLQTHWKFFQQNNYYFFFVIEKRVLYQLIFFFFFNNTLLSSKKTHLFCKYFRVRTYKSFRRPHFCVCTLYYDSCRHLKHFGSREQCGTNIIFLDKWISEYICYHKYWKNEYLNIFRMIKRSRMNMRINSI